MEAVFQSSRTLLNTRVISNKYLGLRRYQRTLINLYLELSNLCFYCYETKEVLTKLNQPIGSINTLRHCLVHLCMHLVRFVQLGNMNELKNYMELKQVLIEMKKFCQKVEIIPDSEQFFPAETYEEVVSRRQIKKDLKLICANFPYLFESLSKALHIENCAGLNYDLYSGLQVHELIQGMLTSLQTCLQVFQAVWGTVEVGELSSFNCTEDKEVRVAMRKKRRRYDEISSQNLERKHIRLRDGQDPMFVCTEESKTMEVDSHIIVPFGLNSIDCINSKS